jgi:hypothetical protein
MSLTFKPFIEGLRKIDLKLNPELIPFVNKFMKMNLVFLDSVDDYKFAEEQFEKDDNFATVTLLSEKLDVVTNEINLISSYIEEARENKLFEDIKNG